MLLSELRTETIQEWLNDLPHAAETKRNTLKAMRQALKKGITWSYTTTNAATAVDLPDEDPRPPRPFQSQTEVDRLAAAFQKPLYSALVVFACETGLRPQEWQALRWSDVNTSERELTIRGTIRNRKIEEGKAKTKRSLRTVALSDRALAALNSLPRPLRDDPLVFAGRGGAPIGLASFRSRPWKRALAASGIEYREVYAMRDTYATSLLNLGISSDLIAAQMGNTPAIVLKHYGLWQKTSHEKMLDLINDAAEQTGQKPDSLELAQ